MEGVGHHSPGETSLVDACSTLFDVLSHQGFTSGDNNKHLMWIRFFRDSIEHLKEIFLGHVLAFGLHLTVAATMSALQIAAQGTLPEQLTQRMFITCHLLLLPPQFKGYFLLKGQRCRFHFFCILMS